jgi:hypothetical protein
LGHGRERQAVVMGFQQFMERLARWAARKDAFLLSLDKAMLRNLALVSILIGMFSGCRHDRLLVGEHPSELVGAWRLLIRSSCTEYGVKADILVLYDDGRFDQHVTMNDGKHFDVAAQHWSYDSGGGTGHISLDKRMEFFAPEDFGKSKGARTFEDLRLEFKSEPVIVLDPDSNCVYEKSGSNVR